MNGLDFVCGQCGHFSAEHAGACEHWWVREELVTGVVQRCGCVSYVSLREAMR